MTPRAPLRLLFVCLLSLAPLRPGVALAAEDAPRTSRYSLLSEPDAAGDASRLSREESERPRASRIGRILAEAGGGVLLSAGAGLAGGLGAAGVCVALGINNDSHGLGCLAPVLLGSAVGLALGYPIGVWKGGEWAGGDGRLLSTAAGTILGLAVGVAFVAWVPFQNDLFKGTPLLLGAVGGIAGYEWSQRAPSAALAATRPRVQPLVSVSSQGALLGLGGRF